MRDAKGDSEIAVEHAYARWRAIGVDLPCGALNDGAEGNFTPVIFEQIAQERFQTRWING
jgi:hypothetical protein